MMPNTRRNENTPRNHFHFAPLLVDLIVVITLLVADAVVLLSLLLRSKAARVYMLKRGQPTLLH